NLVPPQDKRELRLLNIFLALKNIVSFALICAITVAFGLITTRIFLQNYFSYLVASNTLTLDASRSSAQEMRTIAQELTTAKRIQGEYVPWSQLLFALGENVNNGITLSDLRISADGHGEISGTAKTRDDLLHFHDQLVGSGITEEFTIPLAVKFQEKDVKFRFPLQFKIPHLQIP
ncbi:MAG: hypothetical protein PHI63_06530, partial [Patescibacteria group bacterium]|nr:hypothetical protein [Patescibacteria group bacterium]